MRTIVEGVERFTVELSGSADPALAAALPPGVEAEENPDGTVPVNVLFFWMDGLRPRALPGPRLDYHEALFRVGVRHEGAAAWLSVACDLDSAFVRATGAALIRYPVRAARLSVDPHRVAVETPRGTLVAEIEETEEALEAPPPRVALTRKGETLYRIPWEEVAPPHCRAARVRILQDTLSEATFGVPVRYAGRALSMQGRVHRCGVAGALPRG